MHSFFDQDLNVCIIRAQNRRERMGTPLANRKSENLVPPLVNKLKFS